MPVVSKVVSVGTSAVEISAPSIAPKLVYVQDGDYATQSEIYVGDDSVTTAAGVKLSKANVSVFQINADDSLHAISDSESAEVRVVEIT